MSRKRKAHGSEAGFTLLELLVVLAILALLAGLVAPRVMGYFTTAKRETAEIQIRRLSTILEYYRLDTGRYPTAAEGLRALVERPAGAERWNGPYLEGGLPLDPWGHPYVYRAPADGAPYEILSLGADGRPGGEGEDADVSSLRLGDAAG